MLKEVHLLASCCKSYYTDEMIKGIDICRRACGGHGFLDTARFHELHAEYSTFATLEGENTVL